MVLKGAKDVKTAADWIKWVFGILLGAVALIFTAGVVYNQFITENATKDDLSIHINNDLKPVKAEVSEVKKGVNELLQIEMIRAKKEADGAELRTQRRRLEAYRADYQERLAEYTASKASGKRATKPRKEPEHVTLEAELAP